MNTLSFAEHWKYPSVLEREIENCAYSETRKTGKRYKSGRPLYRTSFFSASGAILETRNSMQLTSKRTEGVYYVVESDAAIARTATVSGADVIAELYDSN